jgi:hypothetical protein
MQIPSKIKSRSICATVLSFGACFAGCTTNATRDAIGAYQHVQDEQQQLFDRSLEIANQQMFYSLSSYLRANAGNPETAATALKAAWTARQALEEIRVEYSYERAKSNLTVGQYLYDQQGWVSVVGGDLASQANSASQAATTADKAAGVNSVMDLLPTIPKGTAAATKTNK